MSQIHLVQTQQNADSADIGKVGTFGAPRPYKPRPQPANQAAARHLHGDTIETAVPASFFTQRERTEKTHTIHQALDLARWRFRYDKHFDGQLNTTALSGRESMERITLEDCNRIADRIEEDTRRNLSRNFR